MKTIGALLVILGIAVGAGAQQAPIVAKDVADQKMMAIPNAPACFVGTVEKGDPAKEPSFMFMRGKAGCTVPWHWHPAEETIMLTRGTAFVEMKDSPSVTLKPESFLAVPPHHAMRFRCVTACELFVHTGGAFEIHYVDEKGNEITPESALHPKE